MLGDTTKRTQYDQFGHAGPGMGGFGPGSPGRAGGARAYTWSPSGPQQGAPVDFEEMFGGGGGGGGRGGFMGMSLDDILGGLRGGSGGGRRSGGVGSRPVRGEDIEYHLNIDYPQALSGTTTTLRLEKMGSRGGEGSETITVKIPPGVREGSRIRVRGKGGQGPEPGDLYIVTHLAPHRYFRHEGDDLYVDVPIGIAEAALGCQLDVPTLEGLSTVKVPPGTGSSKKLRLRGKGLGGGSGSPRGDLYVVLQVVPPPSLSPRGTELLKEFEKAEKFNPRANVPWK